MAKTDINTMMSLVDEMNSLLADEESAREDFASRSLGDDIEKLIIESFTRWFNKESEIDLSSTYLKGRRTKVSDKNFTKMINAMAPEISKSDIIILKDTTFFDADEGMIITADKIYFRNSKSRGEINIRDITSIYTKRAFWGNTVDITDSDDNVWHLGQISALKEHLEALDEAFEELIAGLKKDKESSS